MVFQGSGYFSSRYWGVKDITDNYVITVAGFFIFKVFNRLFNFMHKIFIKVVLCWDCVLALKVLVEFLERNLAGGFAAFLTKRI